MEKILIRLIGLTFLAASIGSTASAQVHEVPAASPALELPVVLKQKVTAGKTAVGTRVRAKLVIATLVNGTVIPQDAILSGEVIESAARTKTEPSRLGIRMDSAAWKHQSAAIKLYLTSWYYLPAPIESSDLSSGGGGPGAGRGSLNGAGSYPNPNSPIGQYKFPSQDSGQATGPGASRPPNLISTRRLTMKGVEFMRKEDGAFFLSSRRTNLKLDRTMNYVFAGGSNAGAAAGH
jgi:hypothetical protein